jgi:arsenate reductase
MTERPPVVLFVCTHNAGRSALAAALARTHFGDRIAAQSAGVNPQQAPSKVTITSLAELGIDDSHHVPTALTPERVAHADIVIAMKPGLDIPHVDHVRYETWSLPDPHGWDIDNIRALRDEIGRRVTNLAETLHTHPGTPAPQAHGPVGPSA